jgi:hypothetical protein
VAALVLASPPPLELLLVAGRTVVEQGRLVTAAEDEVAAELARVSRRLAEAAGVA